MREGAPGAALGIVGSPVRATGLVPPFSRTGLPSMLARAPLITTSPEALISILPLAAMLTETPLTWTLFAVSMATHEIGRAHV